MGFQRLSLVVEDEEGSEAVEMSWDWAAETETMGLRERTGKENKGDGEEKEMGMKGESELEQSKETLQKGALRKPIDSIAFHVKTKVVLVIWI